MWFAVVNASGELVSTGTVLADDAELAARGLSKVALDAEPGDRVWDVATQAFIAPPVAPTVLSRLEFVWRFQPAEFMTIKASTDPGVQFFLYQLESAQEVHPSHPVVQQGLQYLVGLGLLTAERAATIGAD